MPANPKVGKALLRRLPMEERFGMAQFSHLLGHVERRGCLQHHSMKLHYPAPFHRPLWACSGRPPGAVTILSLLSGGVRVRLLPFFLTGTLNNNSL